jgi:hypothetical protein
LAGQAETSNVRCLAVRFDRQVYGIEFEFA